MAAATAGAPPGTVRTTTIASPSSTVVTSACTARGRRRSAAPAPRQLVHRAAVGQRHPPGHELGQVAAKRRLGHLDALALEQLAQLVLGGRPGGCGAAGE